MNKDPYMILKYPISTEKVVKLMEKENKLMFLVDLKAKKQEIKNAVEKAFEVKVDKVNTYVSIKGEKRAYIKLNKNYPAIDIMTRLGLM